MVGVARAHGMTLIELLVTIVILVTVLAAVLPAISPNNDARKIREASRQLTALFAQAHAQAARDGRPVGVGFEDLDGDGIAIEAFLIASPPPYTGLASYSKARLRFENGDVTGVQFVVDGPYIADPTTDPDNCYTLDPIPPNVIRFGDAFEVGGFRFVLTDADLNGDGSDETNPVPRQGDLYSHTTPRALFRCKYAGSGPFVPRARWNFNPPQGADPPPRNGWASPDRYEIHRRPGSAQRPSRSAAAVLQFPRGVGIDLFASGFEPQLHPQSIANNVYEYGFTTMQSPRLTALTSTSSPTPAPMKPTPSTPMTVAIMISPTGQFESAYVNGEQFGNSGLKFSHIHLLMGRSENGGIDPTNTPDLDFSSSSAPAGAAGDEIVREARSKYNWLSADSRWVNIDAASGRVVASDVAVPDPRLLQSAQNNAAVNLQILQQINASRAFAEHMEVQGGR